MKTFFEDEFDAHRELVAKTKQACEEPFYKLVDICVQAIENDHKIIFFGNGGSAADAQHLAAELTVRYIKDRPPIRALALTTDASSLTACGNDFGFQEVFSRQMRAHGRAGDVAIGISTSGNSTNVILALEAAQSMGITTAALTGRNGGKMRTMTDPCLIVPSASTARIQEMHILLGHILCATLEVRLGLVELENMAAA